MKCILKLRSALFPPRFPFHWCRNSLWGPCQEACQSEICQLNPASERRLFTLLASPSTQALFPSEQRSRDRSGVTRGGGNMDNYKAMVLVGWFRTALGVCDMCYLPSLVRERFNKKNVTKRDFFYYISKFVEWIILVFCFYSECVYFSEFQVFQPSICLTDVKHTVTKKSCKRFTLRICLKNILFKGNISASNILNELPSTFL